MPKDKNMLKRERQEYIFRKLNLHNRVLSNDLSLEMGVSEDTIRRDLNELAELGKLMKVHGGALSRSFHSSFLRADTDIYQLNEKRIIAAKVLPHIKDGMFILTTGGTTVIEMARMLPENLNATFITASIPAAYEYSHHPNIELIFIGGKVSKNSQISIGGEVISSIREVYADLCILGVNAIDVNKGVTDNDWDVVQIKKAMMGSSKKTMVLSISEKVNTCQRLKICSIEDIDCIVTELDPEHELFNGYKNRKTAIL